MIVSFLHKGLALFFHTGSKKGINPQHAQRLRLQLSALHTATAVTDLDLPGYKLHALKGDKQSIWSISVSGNWRITFRFENANAEIVHYEDYQ